MFRRSLWAALVAAAMTLACSDPPTNERHQAEGALAAARAADAETYAPDELKAAETALSKYDAAVAQRDYRQALNLAIEARDTAYEAVKQAGNEKAAARSRAEKLVNELEQLLHTASMRPPPPARPGDHPRTDLKAAASSLQEARTLLTQGSFTQVVALVSPIVEQLRKELGQPGPAADKRGR